MENQVVYEYDANGLLAKDFSNPSGAVAIASTPYNGCTYEATKLGKYFTRHLRLATIKYPSGKVLTNQQRHIYSPILPIPTIFTFPVSHTHNSFSERVHPFCPASLNLPAGSFSRFHCYKIQQRRTNVCIVANEGKMSSTTFSLYRMRTCVICIISTANGYGTKV